MWARSWSVWIPGRQVGLNDLLHSRSARVKKSKGAGALALVFQASGVPRCERVSLAFEWVEPNRSRDPDSIVSGGSKVIIDAIKRSGIIDNDGWRSIAGLSHTWRCDPTAPGVMVTITES
jgi:hypothetical protein